MVCGRCPGKASLEVVWCLVMGTASKDGVAGVV